MTSTGCRTQYRCFYELAPDLAVEVVSPSNTRRELREKLADYVDAGVQELWVIRPMSWTHRRPRAHRCEWPVSRQSGLETSAQLEGFRRDSRMPLVLPSRTLWSSATMTSEWFDTVDFRAHLPSCRVLQLPNEDRNDARVLKRLSAPKRLIQAPARRESTRKADVKTFVAMLCDDILAAHSGDAPLLVILNRVGRAQDVYRLLRDRLEANGSATTLMLVHARFRALERATLNARVRKFAAG